MTGAAPRTRRTVPFARPEITAQDREAVDAVLRSEWLTTGAACEALEAELSAYLGVDHVLALSSCTAALETAYAFLDLPPGSRVAVPTWTFAASALAPARAGAVPVLLDVDPDTLAVSPESLATAIDEGVDAAVLVHFGGAAFGKEVHDICAAAGVPLIEDAAHALGASDHRGLVAGQGSAGAAFSFYATKNLTSAEGGALATDDDELAGFARSYRLHGLSRDAWRRYRPDGSPLYDLAVPGIKGNLPDVLAALARSQLARFDGMQQARRRAVRRYRANLAGIDGLEVLPRAEDEGSADHLFVVALPEHVDRSAVVRRLTELDIGTSVHFQPLHHLTWFAEHAQHAPGGLGVADRMASRVLSLPLYSLLEDEDVDTVCEALSDAIAPA